MSRNKQACKQKYIFLDRLKHNAKTQPWGLAKIGRGGRGLGGGQLRMFFGIERLIRKHFEVLKKSHSFDTDEISRSNRF